MDHIIKEQDDVDDDDDIMTNCIPPTSRIPLQHRSTSTTSDRPPRSPIRTTSKKVPPFTRSRVFPSIRRKRKLPMVSILFKNTTPITKRKCRATSTVMYRRMCMLWLVIVLILLSTYWYNVQELFISRLLTPQQQQQQQQHMNRTIRSADAPTTNPWIATNFSYSRRQQRYRRRQFEKRDNLIHDTTNNDTAHRNVGVVLRTKEERMAPLLEMVDQRNLVHGTFHTNVPSHLFQTIHRFPARTTLDADGMIHSCIVTAYFKLSNSKHHIEQYDLWMQNMLSMHDCMVIYCEADMVSKILQYRSIDPSSTTTTILGTNHTAKIQSFGPTTIIQMSLTDLPISKYYPNRDASPVEFWNRQLQMDPERKIHQSYELFWIWLSKSWFVTTAAVLQHHLFLNRSVNAATSIDAWMWVDIGSFRGTEYKNQPLIQQHEQIIPDNDTVLWMAHRKPNPPSDPYWNRKLLTFEKQHFYHSGSQAIAKNVTAWIDFHRHFVDTLDEYTTKDLFIGEDQCVLQTTCLLHPKSCAYVPNNQVHDNKYFGLRHVVHYGISNNIHSNRTNQPFQLWRPPLQQLIDTTL